MAKPASKSAKRTPAKKPKPISPALKSAQKGAKAKGKTAAAKPPKAGKPAKTAAAAPLAPTLMDEGKAHAVRPSGDGSAERIVVPFSKIQPGENYRKTFDEESLAGLADSILQQGILQNLVVLPADTRGLYTIAAGGERRYRAVEMLIKQKRATSDFPVPVLVQAMSADQALAMSIVENLQREEVHPVEEAEGFRRLRDDFKWTTTKIAEALGGKERLRFVQQRLNIADKLTPKAREAFHEGTINLDQARALWALPPILQGKVLADKQLAKSDAGDIRRAAQELCARGRHALFEPSRYDGESYTDGKETFYVDVKQFGRLQKEAIDERIGELRSRWSDVVIQTGHWIDTAGYEPTKKRDEGIAIVLRKPAFYNAPYELIEVREGLRKAKPKKAGNDAEAGGKPAHGLAKKTLIEAHHLKTIELQRAVAAAPATIAMALTIIALLPAQYSYCESVQIRRERRTGGGASLSSFNTPAEHHLAGLLTRYVEAGMIGIERDGEAIVGISSRPSARAALFHALIVDETLEEIFAATIARDVGSFPGFEPRYGDSALVVAIADVTDATLQGKWRMTAPYLDPFRKDQMQAIANACIGGFEITPSTKKSDASLSIRAHPNRNEDWLPPELHYGTGSEIAEAVSAMLGVPIEVPVDRDREDDEDWLGDGTAEPAEDTLDGFEEEVEVPADAPADEGDDHFAGSEEAADEPAETGDEEAA